MVHQKLATVTNELIASYGHTAQNVITAYRVGSQRAVVLMDESWLSVVNKAATRLGDETRNNAVVAEKKLTEYYTKGVEFTSTNASAFVEKAMEVAGKGVVQVAANATRFEKSTGVTTLNTLATKAVPVAQAASKVAAKLEEKSNLLVTKLGGKTVKAKVAAAKRTATRKVASVKKAA